MSAGPVSVRQCLMWLVLLRLVTAALAAAEPALHRAAQSAHPPVGGALSLTDVLMPDG